MPKLTFNAVISTANSSTNVMMVLLEGAPVKKINAKIGEPRSGAARAKTRREEITLRLQTSDSRLENLCAGSSCRL